MLINIKKSWLFNNRNRRFNIRQLIKDYKEFKANETIENITEGNLLEEKCNSLNKQFEDIINKIKKQNLNIIQRVILILIIIVIIVLNLIINHCYYD